MIDVEFNDAIMETAKHVSVVPFKLVCCWDKAPKDYEELFLMTDRDGFVSAAIQDGDYSIFGDPTVQGIFMGWHDGEHYRHRLGFNLAGEACAGYLHLYQMVTLFKYHPDMPKWGAYLLSRFIGQGVYYARHGHSPNSQQDFHFCNYERFIEPAEKLIHLLVSEEHAINEACKWYGNGVMPK